MVTDETEILECFPLRCVSLCSISFSSIHFVFFPGNLAAAVAAAAALPAAAPRASNDASSPPRAQPNRTSGRRRAAVATPPPPPNRRLSSPREALPPPPVRTRLSSRGAGAPSSSATGATSACPNGRGSAEAAAVPASPAGPAAVLNGSSERPLVVLPVPSRSRGAGRTRGTTNGRCGFDLHPDPDAARRAVAIPAAAVNRLPVFQVLNISGPDVIHIKRLAKSAAKVFDPLVTFCAQARVDIDVAVRHLERFEPRLGVCVRSWGACCLLSKVANNSAAYHKALAKKGQAGQAAAAAATAGGATLPSPTRPLPPPPTRRLPPPPTRPLPPPPNRSVRPSSPAARVRSGTNASDHATVDSATGAQSAEDFFASHR